MLRCTHERRIVPQYHNDLTRSGVFIMDPSQKVKGLKITHCDEYAKKGYDAHAYDFSAVSNRSFAEIAAASRIRPLWTITACHIRRSSLTSFPHSRRKGIIGNERCLGFFVLSALSGTFSGSIWVGSVIVRLISPS